MSSEEMHNPFSGGKVTALSLQVCVGCDTQKDAGDRDCMAQHSLGAKFTQDVLTHPSSQKPFACGCYY